MPSPFTRQTVALVMLRDAMSLLCRPAPCLALLALAMSLFTLAMGICVAQDQPDAVDTSASPVSPIVNPVGAWVGEQSFGNNRSTRTIHIRFEGDRLTGSFEQKFQNTGNLPPGLGDPVPIDDVKLTGDTITFTVTRSFNGNEFKTSYWGVIVGDEIAGVSSFSVGGNERESEWLARREVAVDEPASAPQADEPVAATAAAVSTTLTLPQPTRIPDPGAPTDEPYEPRAILPGGIVMPLYPADSPHLNSARIKEPETYNLSSDVHGRINSIVNIHNPSIEVHFASPAMNTGAVVILAAGGGHRTLNVGTESADFVPFFYNYGVNTVILRNRLRSDGYEPTTDAVRDALQSIRLVRKFAEAWKFDPNKIGIMGFSAGAELSAPAAIEFESFDKEHSEPNDPLAGISSRPDFVGIIYPGPTPFTREPEREVPRNSPPAFITCAGAGDRIHAIWATDYFSAMLRAGVPNVEMHIYGNGYHPGDRGSTGGLTYRSGIPFGSWQQRFIEWFDDLGFLAAPGEETKGAIDSREFVSQPPRERGGPRRGPRDGPRDGPPGDRGNRPPGQGR